MRPTKAAKAAAVAPVTAGGDELDSEGKAEYERLEAETATLRLRQKELDAKVSLRVG